jgi:hypothetical protein
MTYYAVYLPTMEIERLAEGLGRRRASRFWRPADCGIESRSTHIEEEL